MRSVAAGRRSPALRALIPVRAGSYLTRFRDPLLLAGARLRRLPSWRRVRLPGPDPKALPDRPRRGVGGVGLRVGATPAWHASAGDHPVVSGCSFGWRFVGAVRGAAALLFVRLLQRTAGVRLKPSDVGRTGGRRDSVAGGRSVIVNYPRSLRVSSLTPPVFGALSPAPE